MNTYHTLFKTDFFNGLIALAKKVWVRIFYSYLIYYFSALVIGGLFALISILGVVDTDLVSQLMSSPSPEDSLLIFQKISDIIITPGFIISFVIVMLIVLIMASWNYYFAFLTSNSEVNEKKYSFGELFKLSFSVEVFKLMGITIVLNLIMGLMFAAAALSVTFSGFLALFMFLAVFVICMRFILVMPAFIIGNYDFNSAFAFSFYHINWSRAFKFFGIGILFFLILMGISLFIGLISGALSFIPFVGTIIQMAVNIFFGAIMMTVTVTALTGLFYRYANTEIVDENKLEV